MFETPFTIVGTIVTDPIHRRVGDQEVFKFRVASNSRRRTADGDWEQGNSLFVTVNCWGRLVDGRRGVAGQGRPGDRRRAPSTPASTRTATATGGRRSRCVPPSVGPDLARSTARIDAAQAAAEPTSRTPRPQRRRRGPRTTSTRRRDRGRGPATDGVAAERPRLGWCASDTRRPRKAHPTAWPNSSTRCGRSARRTATRSSLTTSR